MKIKTLLTICSITALSVSSIWAQNTPVKRCGTTEHMQDLMSKNPALRQEMIKYSENLDKWMKKNPEAASQRATITIPVVVHVVYKTAAQNISDAVIQSQIDVLNADFTHTNADASNTPSVWQSIAGNSNIVFCLAKVDPNGNPTTGIDRKQTNTQSFTDDAVKSASTGGADSWDVTKYFNIWSCNLGGGLLGYAEFPTSTASNTYGLVIGYSNFGVTTTGAPYNKGRTATHEIGHCFNLYHIWGDDGSACSGSDNVSDTPNQAGENYGAPTFPLTDACQTSSPGVMFMNYMDYTDDAAMNMFTAVQVSRMLAVVNNPPYNALKTSTVCQSASTGDDAGISAIASPSGTLCSGTIAPSVTLSNFGSTTLTSAIINYDVDGGASQTYSWSGSIASGANTSVNLPSVTTSGGAHTFNASTSLPNGVSDVTSTNDAASSSFTVVTSGQSLPLTESFEGTFPPTGWTLSNPDGLTTLEQTTQAAIDGSSSVWIDNTNYNANGQVDALLLPALDLTTQSNPDLSFEYAYSMYTDPSTSPNYSDTLVVSISTDCGVTYTEIMRDAGASLATATPNFTTAQYVPAGVSEWRLITLSLSSYASSTNAIIKFSNITDYENSLFLDKINILGTPLFTNTINAARNSIFNTSNAGVYQVVLAEEPVNGAKIEVVNIVGQVVYTDKLTSKESLIDIKNQPSGTYIVKVQNNNDLVIKKVSK